jgi:hypothetical protein
MDNGRKRLKGGRKDGRKGGREEGAQERKREEEEEKRGLRKMGEERTRNVVHLYIRYS